MLSRRLILTLFATSSAVLLSRRTARTAVLASVPEWRWRGIALGAWATITLQHPDEAIAKAVLAEAVAEIARLEAILSLHRQDSALMRLNRDTVLDAPPADLVWLLGEALRFARLSDGLFDPTIQPLWMLLQQSADPASQEVTEAQMLVDWRNVELSPQRIRLAPGMAVTLNGIAQGYITDRVGDLLRRRGFDHVFVNLGEGLALGPKTDGADWIVGILDPAQPEQIATIVPIKEGAIATSGGYSFILNDRFNHLINPHMVTSPPAGISVTVLAPTATVADVVSTILALDPQRVDGWTAVPEARILVRLP